MEIVAECFWDAMIEMRSWLNHYRWSFKLIKIRIDRNWRWAPRNGCGSDCAASTSRRIRSTSYWTKWPSSARRTSKTTTSTRTATTGAAGRCTRTSTATTATTATAITPRARIQCAVAIPTNPAIINGYVTPIVLFFVLFDFFPHLNRVVRMLECFYRMPCMPSIQL